MKEIRNMIYKIRIKILPKKRRIIISVMAGMLAAVLTAGGPELSAHRNIVAWWGSIYPEFCFSRLPEENDRRKEDVETKDRRPEISFWLAKALNW